MNLPGDPGLPPGISERAFDGGPEACEACDGTGELNVSECCGASLAGEWGEQMICPLCGEDCSRWECEGCGGSGTGEAESERHQRIEEEKAERWIEEERIRSEE